MGAEGGVDDGGARTPKSWFDNVATKSTTLKCHESGERIACGFLVHDASPPASIQDGVWNLITVG